MNLENKNIVEKATVDNKVFVLDMNGNPMDGTERFGKVRKMLRDGQAKIVERNPFTIQLLYEPENKKAFEEKKAQNKKEQYKPKKQGNFKSSSYNKKSNDDRERSQNNRKDRKFDKSNAGISKEIRKPNRNSTYVNGKMKSVPKKETKTIKTKSGKTIIINTYK